MTSSPSFVVAGISVGDGRLGPPITVLIVSRARPVRNGVGMQDMTRAGRIRACGRRCSPDVEARMRPSWLLAASLGAGVLAGRGASGQDRPAPPVLPPALPTTAPPAGTPAATLSALLNPPAPEPIPGPASTGLPRGGMSVPTPKGLPINLATALQLAGVRPLDIAAATRPGRAGPGAEPPGQGAVDPQHQRRRRLLPPRRRPAEHLHRRELPQGPPVVLRRRRAVPVGGPDRRDLRPAGGAAGGRVADGGPPGRAQRRAAPGHAGVLRPPGGAGAAAGDRRVDRPGRAAGELHPRAGPQPDRAPGDQPGPDRAADPAPDPAGGHPRLAGRQRPARRGPAARPGDAAGAGRAAVPAGHARPLRRDARDPGADRRAQPPRDRLAARAGRRRRAAPPPREGPPVPALPVRPQPDHVDRPARRRQLLVRPQRRA